MNLVAIAIPFFVLMVLVEYIYGRANGRNTYALTDTVADPKRPRKSVREKERAFI
jgi:hypothetical protein